VTGDQEVESFDELVRLIRGMRGHIVDASVFLPWEDGGWPVAMFSGRLHEIEVKEDTRSPRLVLSWTMDGEAKPHAPEVAFWERRFVRAELSFTGSVDDGRYEDGLEVDETHGHNIFLKVYSEGWIVDLISYVGA
jgi:hypothetical protein